MGLRGKFADTRRLAAIRSSSTQDRQRTIRCGTGPRKNEKQKIASLPRDQQAAATAANKDKHKKFLEKQKEFKADCDLLVPHLVDLDEKKEQELFEARNKFGHKCWKKKEQKKEESQIRKRFQDMESMLITPYLWGKVGKHATDNEGVQL